jgi:hypothetical protein
LAWNSFYNSDLEPVPRAKVVHPWDLRLKSSYQKTYVVHFCTGCSANHSPGGYLIHSAQLAAKFITVKEAKPTRRAQDGQPAKYEKPAMVAGFLYLYFQCSEVDRAKWQVFEELFQASFKLEIIRIRTSSEAATVCSS